MSVRVRCAVALVAGAGVASLALALLSPFLPLSGGTAEAVADWGMPLAGVCAVLLLGLLYGHATGCPACGRWWSRSEVVGRLVGREGSAKGGLPFAAALSRTTYQCGGCGHRWSVENASVVREPARDRPPRHGG
jgi:hypothetical protein